MAKKSSFQVKAEYFAAKAVFAFARVMPRQVLENISLLGYYGFSKLRKTGLRSLEIAFPELEETSRREILKGSFKSLGRMLSFVSRFDSYSRDDLAKLIDFRFDAAAVNAYDELRASGRGAIILSPHMGNWELLVFAYAALKEPISYLARPLDNPLIEDLTVKLRTRFGNKPINKTNAVSLALKILREGGLLGILADVNAHPKEGIFVPYFGVPACTSAGVAMMALRCNVPIIPLCGVWEKAENKYIAINGRIIEPAPTGNREADLERITAEFTAEIEKLVRRYPEQWLWIHKRWKTRPSGEPELY